MDKVEEVRNDKMVDINDKLDTIHMDIKRLIERSNKEYLDLMLDNLKKDLINSIKSYVSDDVDRDLERAMVDPCYMRETCKLKFTDFLRDNDDLILKDNVSKDVINDKKAELDEIKKRAPYDRCDICLTEVNSLFNKQLGLISSLQVYNSNEENRSEISTISEEFMVKNILEPLSNKQRLQILKAMAVESKSFSSLSKLTGLRGGNLLFHIQKLLESDLIFQQHERGDYMITKTGFKLLTMLADFQRQVSK